MKNHIHLLPSCLAAALPLFLFCSCVENKKFEPPKAAAALETAQQHRTVVEPSLLPNRFQQTGYMIREESTDSSSGGSNAAGLDGLQLKVGANISTNEPIPLREAMKAIAKTKNMSLSWAPDVDQELLVDIGITANDNFYEAIDNILRQLDYFHEMEGSTIVVKYRETKKYHIAMPFVRQYYDSFTGSTSGSLQNKPWENKFDQWEIIQNNIDKIVATWSSTAATPAAAPEAQPAPQPGAEGKAEAGKTAEDKTAVASRRVSSTDSTYTIDKPVGLITVNAPKSLQNKIKNYLENLEKELYKQIIIEAKIIEVQLNDSSSLGINWNMLLEKISFHGLGYSKSKSTTRENSDDKTTTSSVSYDDVTTDDRLDSSYNENKTLGARTLKDSKSKKDGRLKDNTSTFVTGDGKNLDNLTNHTTENISGTSSAGELTTNTLSDDISSKSVARSITDALSMGTTAATFIGSGGTMAESIATGVTLEGFNFTSFIKALQEQGQTSILSNPKISVLNGQPALIKVGKDITYISALESKRAEGGGIDYTVKTSTLLSGIGMALSAVARDNNEIVMNLSPVTSELVGETIFYETVGFAGKIGLPVINKREMNTWVKVKDGSMLVVGGLISEVESKDGSYLPGAKDVPYLKYLFGYEEKKKTKRELIMLLRPRIIN
ncbi:hypothetical protein [Candidatus Electronema sp. PJ]|uniref:hypothetical protein n=1 Tax=Candidatus Electronema sp. PJ TaxID=3401572 RepID=UPI003AA89C89